MPFYDDEIANRLRAFRLGSGLSADEIAARVGISRTALYRFEKGELVKLETLEKLAQLLNVSVATLLGVSVEYVVSPVSYFERMRQLEETAEHIIMLAGPISFLLATERFEDGLEQSIIEGVPDSLPNRSKVLADVKTIIALLRERKQQYLRRRPSIVKILSALEIQRFLLQGLVGKRFLPEKICRERRELALAEIEHIARTMEAEPIGVQIGIVTETLPLTGFYILRHSDRATLTVSPFRLSQPSNVLIGVATITSAPEAVALHETIVRNLWVNALKGEAGARYLRDMVSETIKLS